MGKFSQEKYATQLTLRDRDKIREQNEIGEEILNAITNNPIGTTVDDMELEEALEELQQEQLDEQMLKTGNPPVLDDVHKLPTPVHAEREDPFRTSEVQAMLTYSKRFHVRSSPSKKTTRRPSSGNYKPRWPSDEHPPFRSLHERFFCGAD